MPPQFRTASRWYAGTADAVYQNIYLLERDRPESDIELAVERVLGNLPWRALAGLLVMLLLNLRR
ncbi:MAG: hypothetical protein HC933_21580 [Pleurocapsa sp. SU_196_0]|nr:hypothetical protein [Pleurocapsa sp. SU_196_0]